MRGGHAGCVGSGRGLDDMVRKISAGILAVFCVLLLAACGQKDKMGENMYQVYYVSNSETRVEVHSHEMQAKEPEGQLDELVACLSTNPEKLEYKAPFAMGFQILNRKLEDGKLLIDVNAAYLDLSVTTAVLVRAAIVRTLTQLSEIRLVMMTVEGNPLYDNSGGTIGWMNSDSFINNDGNEINTYELVGMKLYFAGEDGTKLVGGYREKHYPTSMLLERFVVEELIAGPSGQVEGLYPSINPDTKVLGVTTRDGVCYVNLDENFLTVVNNVSTDVSIYSIVNSLSELSNINKVQILINGEVPSSFTASTFERNLDMVTTLEK